MPDIAANQRDAVLARKNVIETYCMKCGGVEAKERLFVSRVRDTYIGFEFKCAMRLRRRLHSCELRMDRQELQQGRLVIGVRCLQCDEDAIGQIRAPAGERAHDAFYCPSVSSHRWSVDINGGVF